jgi:hypothetical protein
MISEESSGNPPSPPAPKGLALLGWLRAVRGEKESSELGSDC